MKIRELYTDASKWCQGADSRNAQGEATYANPVAWCLRGAYHYCYDGTNTGHTFEAFQKLCLALGPNDIVSWNDKKHRTFAEVKALVDELDI